MRLHDQDLRGKLERWRARNERQEQRLVRFVDKCFTSSAPTFVAGRVSGKNVIPTSYILRQCTNHGSAAADNLE